MKPPKKKRVKLLRVSPAFSLETILCNAIGALHLPGDDVDELLPGKPMSSTSGGRFRRSCDGRNGRNGYLAAAAVVVRHRRYHRASLDLSPATRPRGRVCAVGGLNCIPPFTRPFVHVGQAVAVGIRS